MIHDAWVLPVCATYIAGVASVGYIICECYGCVLHDL